MMLLFEQYITSDRLIRLLIKERVKCCRRNRDQIDFSVHPELNSNEQSTRKFLSTIFPPRATWIKPRNRKPFRMSEHRVNTRRLNAQALRLTIERDRLDTAHSHPYLERLDRYVEHLRQMILSGNFELHEPQLSAEYKSSKVVDGHRVITYRPLASYTCLEDKIITAAAARYLTDFFDRSFHRNLLSYRAPRYFWPAEKKKHVTDFNDGVRLIGQFREQHNADTIYASDCDIRKFFDSINHEVIRACFMRLFNARGLNPTGQRLMLYTIDAYLRSYNFTNNVLRASGKEGFWNRHIKRYKLDPDKDVCRFDWMSDDDGAACYGSPEAFEAAKPFIGIPQGGALSPVIANVVLNDVDREAGLVDSEDANRLFVRYCDDMILLHTDLERCQQLMEAYTQSLKSHLLIYHPFQSVPKHQVCHSVTEASFWDQKSHSPYLWGDGEGQANRFVGFLGYELSRDGTIRLRKSNERKMEFKFHKFYFLVFRHIKKNAMTKRLKVSALVALIERSLTRLTGSIHGYEAFQWFPYDEKQITRLDRHRRAMLRRLISRITRKRTVYLRTDKPPRVSLPLAGNYSREERLRIAQTLNNFKSRERGFFRD